MEFFEVLQQRFSCRSFQEKAIREEELLQILNAGRSAPTAVNRQPQRIFVVENVSCLEQLKEATRFTFDAKTILVVCHDPSASWHRKNDQKDHGMIDSSIVASFMMLAATALGIGSTYVCAFDEEKVKAILQIPGEYRINCLLPLGYPNESMKERNRKPLEETVQQIK